MCAVATPKWAFPGCAEVGCQDRRVRQAPRGRVGSPRCELFRERFPGLTPAPSACPPRALTGGHSRSLKVTHVQHSDRLTWEDARSRRSRTRLRGPYKAEVAGSRPAAPTRTRRDPVGLVVDTDPPAPQRWCQAPPDAARLGPRPARPRSHPRIVPARLIGRISVANTDASTPHDSLRDQERARIGGARSDKTRVEPPALARPWGRRNQGDELEPAEHHTSAAPERRERSGRPAPTAAGSATGRATRSGGPIVTGPTERYG